jgi:PKD repeat protein
MKKTIKLFSIVAVLATLLFASCKKEDMSPVADFTMSPNDTIHYTESITFNNTSKNADTYLWNFGDGTASTEINPTKEGFATEVANAKTTETCYSTFTVTLTASKGSKSSTISKNVVVDYCREVSTVEVPAVPIKK